MKEPNLMSLLRDDALMREALRHISRRAGVFWDCSSPHWQGEIITDIRKTADGVLKAVHDIEGGDNGHQQSDAPAEHSESGACGHSSE